jgi:hypothetical protein
MFERKPNTSVMCNISRLIVKELSAGNRRKRMPICHPYVERRIVYCSEFVDKKYHESAKESLGAYCEKF